MRVNSRLKVLLLLVLWPSVVAAMPLKIYVAANGSDGNIGSRRKPLATIETALEKAFQTADSEVEIVIGKGVYSLKKPLQITPKEDFISEKKMTIRGEGMGQTIISGGMELPSFKAEETTGLWYVKLGEELEDGISQLFVNGRRCTLARTPNADYYFVPKKVQERQTCEKPKTFEQEFVVCDKNGNEFALNQEETEDVVVSIFHFWDMTRRRIMPGSKERNSFKIAGENMKRWGDMTKKGFSQVYFENSKSFIDTQGEFYYDKRQRVLYYYPRDGETVDKAKAIVPISKRLLTVSGTKEEPIKNLKIEGITFAYTNYVMPEMGESPQQAAALKDAAVMLNHVKNVRIADVELCHTGLYGVWFQSNCKSSTIEDCYLHDLGAGGVKVGITEQIKEDDENLTKGIRVNNNIICEGGRVMPTAVAVLVMKASDCRVTHNDIFDFYYTGVSVGWTWGFSDSPAKRNYVGYNHIHHIGWAGLSDMGGIYTLGKSEGTVIDNNIIHHVQSYDYDGDGIYTDEGSSGIEIKNNIVYHCKSAGFSQHYGRDNILENNIFAFNHETQIMTAERIDTDKNTLTFRRNIVYADRSSQIFKNDFWGGYPLFLCDLNLYWAEGTDKPLRKKTISGWSEQTGKDANSVMVDPGLVIRGEKDIQVTNKAAMRKISFKPIDCSKVGVQGNRKLRELAKIDPKRAKLFDQIVEENEKPNNTASILNKKEVMFILLAGLTVSGVIGGKMLMRNRG